MKGIIFRIACVVFSLAICLVLAELLARQSLSYVARKSVGDAGGTLEANPELLIEYTARGRRLVPNADVVIHNHYVSGLDVDISTNRLGLRDPDRSAQPAPERVIFLGDSIVVQDYLPGELTLPRLLESALNPETQGKVEIINAGLSNSGLEEEYQLLSEIIGELRPTVVLLSFYLNDSRPAWGFSGEIGNQRGWLRRHSIIAETIIRELEIRKWLSDSRIERFGWIELVEKIPWRSDPAAFQQLVSAAPYDWGSAWDKGSWSDVETRLKQIKKLTEEHGARLGLVMMPVRYQVEAEFLEDYPQRTMQEIAARLEVPLLSLLPVERQFRDREIFFDWCHPNQEGNKIITPVIAGFLQRELFKEKPEQ